jgi:hypothetical protein
METQDYTLVCDGERVVALDLELPYTLPSQTTNEHDLSETGAALGFEHASRPFIPDSSHP